MGTAKVFSEIIVQNPFWDVRPPSEELYEVVAQKMGHFRLLAFVTHQSSIYRDIFLNSVDNLPL